MRLCRFHALRFGRFRFFRDTSKIGTELVLRRFHHLDEGLRRFLADYPANGGRVELFHTSVGVSEGPGYPGSHEDAVIGNCANRRSHLDRRDHDPLPEGVRG